MANITGEGLPADNRAPAPGDGPEAEPPRRSADKMRKKKKYWLPGPVLALCVYTTAAILGILLLKFAAMVTAPIFISCVIAYLFNPVVTFLEKKTPFSRGFAAALIILLLGIGLALIIVGIFPYALEQITSAADHLPAIMDSLYQKLQAISEYLSGKFAKYFGRIDLAKEIQESGARLANTISDSIGSLFSGVISILLTLLYIVFIPLFSFYFLKDARKIQRNFFELIPFQYKQRAILRVEQFNDILSSFIRGQAIVVMILSVLYSVGLSIIGLPFAILIGVFAGVGDIMPYFGTIIGFLVSMVVAFASFDSPEKLLLVMAVFLVVKGSENWFIYPRIVGKEVGLHFVWVLFSIILFGFLFGFWGLLVAIPTAAGFKLLLHDVIDYYKKSDFFKRENE